MHRGDHQVVDQQLTHKKWSKRHEKPSDFLEGTIDEEFEALVPEAFGVATVDPIDFPQFGVFFCDVAQPGGAVFFELGERFIEGFALRGFDAGFGVVDEGRLKLLVDAKAKFHVFAAIGRDFFIETVYRGEVGGRHGRVGSDEIVERHFSTGAEFSDASFGKVAHPHVFDPVPIVHTADADCWAAGL